MEALSPTMEEGRVVKWHKRDGDPVKTGETRAEVETDKAVMDLVARADGVLRQVAAAEGQTVAVGSVVAVIVSPGEAVGAVPAAAAPATPSGSGKREAGNVATVTAPAPVAVTPLPVAAAAEATRVKASPLARRMAKEAGVDLKLVAGSGPGGRVVKKDLDRAPVVAAAPFPVSRVPHPERPGAPYEDVPLTQIRKTIAKRLATSLGPIPHFFLTTEVDMERASEARDALNTQLGDQGKVSFNDIIIKATAHALTKHGACNAWFQEDHIRYWHEVHIGMAVAVEDGLITPVIRNAEQKSLADIGREAKELAERARNRRLQPNEYTGSTFSVSNLGMFDIDQFTAVINPPVGRIIASGSLVQKPAGGGGELPERARTPKTTSAD